MAVLVWGALQVSVSRIPRKEAFLVDRDRLQQVLSLLSCYKTVILGRSWRQEGDATHPGPTTWEQQGLPSWQTRAYSPQQVEVCARRAYLCPLAAWYLRREGGSWVWHSRLTSEEILTYRASSAEYISLPSRHHYSGWPSALITVFCLHVGSSSLEGKLSSFIF